MNLPDVFFFLHDPSLPTPWLLAGLCAVAFLAGLVDAVAGGGGLIQVPALLLALPGLLPATVFSTNKVASAFGTASAAWQYHRQGHRIPGIAWQAALLAGPAAFLGARLVSWLPAAWLLPLVILLLVAVLAWTLVRPDFGRLPQARGLYHSSLLWRAGSLGAAVGFYDGLFGPGTGSFFIFGFIAILGVDFLGASVAAKAVNLATNLAALAWFVPHGQVLWALSLPMAVANALGGRAGARLAVRGGALWVRRVFVVVAVVLLVRLGWRVVTGD